MNESEGIKVHGNGLYVNILVISNCKNVSCSLKKSEASRYAIMESSEMKFYKDDQHETQYYPFDYDKNEYKSFVYPHVISYDKLQDKEPYQMESFISTTYMNEYEYKNNHIKSINKKSHISLFECSNFFLETDKDKYFCYVNDENSTIYSSRQIRYFEVTVEEFSDFGIGLAEKEFEDERNIGEGENTIGVHSLDNQGSLNCDQTIESKPFGYEGGNTIGVGYDADTGEAIFTLNNEVMSGPVKLPFIPHKAYLTIRETEGLTINYGEHPFKFNLKSYYKTNQML